MSEVINHANRRSSVILALSERSAVKNIYLKYANADPVSPVIVVTETSAKGSSHALESTARGLRNTHAVLRLPKQAVDKDIGLIPPPGVLRSNHEVICAYLGAIVAAQIDHHAELWLDVPGRSPIPAVQVLVIGISETQGVKAQIGKSPEHVEAWHLLRSRYRS